MSFMSDFLLTCCVLNINPYQWYTTSNSFSWLFYCSIFSVLAGSEKFLALEQCKSMVVLMDVSLRNASLIIAFHKDFFLDSIVSPRPKALPSWIGQNSRSCGTKSESGRYIIRFLPLYFSGWELWLSAFEKFSSYYLTLFLVCSPSILGCVAP